MKLKDVEAQILSKRNELRQFEAEYREVVDLVSRSLIYTALSMRSVVFCFINDHSELYNYMVNCLHLGFVFGFITKSGIFLQPDSSAICIDA